ncbi:parallel beta-helix domain-containing protein [Anaeromyxobacter sp. Red801]|uniref:parallel beta-helix domain-containing protein n=1 Tax=Anaeromyxobacter sp. Red801 TaxID=3411632 RepID=UPI003BA1EEE5
MTARPLAASLAAALLLACGSDSKPKPADPCAGVAAPCTAFPAGTTEDRIQGAVALAPDGATFVFGPGTFRFTNALEVTANGVTIRGAGRDATVLDFAAQVGAEGVGASGDAFTLSDLSIRDTAGNGVKVVGSTGVTIRNVGVSWTRPDLSTHGGYGIYPVQSTDVLIEGCFTSGATDTGIYVGQSQNIVVRNNEATGNVAGVEIENSYDADVHGNHLHGNTAGVLVFDLPGLPQQGGHAVRVFDNRILDNDHANFAPAGGIVAIVPAGSGVVVMANHDVEVFGNTIQGNQTAAVGVISYLLTGQAPPDGYDPFPRRVHVHGNTITGNGTAPDEATPLGAALAQVRTALGTDLPDVVWDGIPDPTGSGENPQEICVAAGASWLSLGAASDPWAPNPDDTAFRCTLDPLPAVVLP